MKGQDITVLILTVISVFFLWGLANMLIYQSKIWKVSVLAAIGILGAGEIVAFIPRIFIYSPVMLSTGTMILCAGAFLSNWRNYTGAEPIDPVRIERHDIRKWLRDILTSVFTAKNGKF